MESNNLRTPSRFTEDAETMGGEALLAAQGYAQGSGRTGSDAAASIRADAEEAADTGRTYAKDAVNATGRKLRDFRGRLDDAKASCARYVADQPVRSTLVAAAAGALLTTLLLSLVRGRGR
ncbi:hypothetical protein J7E62_22795 [Variovorax paradoxus]|nr:hypothetical protein [Variovorax paradoxus]